MVPNLSQLHSKQTPLELIEEKMVPNLSQLHSKQTANIPSYAILFG